MKRFFAWIISNSPFITKGIMFLICIAGIVFMFPRQKSLVLEFQEGRAWLAEDVYAPFNFPVIKSSDALEREAEVIRKAHVPVFEKDTLAHLDWMDCFDARLGQQVEMIGQDPSLGSMFYGWSEDSIRNLYLSRAEDWFMAMMEREIVAQTEEIDLKKGIQLIEGRDINYHAFNDITDLKSVVMEIQNRETRAEPGWSWFFPALAGCIGYNVYFNDSLNGVILEQSVNNLPQALAYMEAGDLVIRRGEMVSQEKAQILSSLQASISERSWQEEEKLVIKLGQTVLVGTLLLMLAVFLFSYRKDMFHNNAVIAFLLLNVFLMVLMAAMFSQKNPEFLYLAPFCILPLVIRAFYDTRVALFVHLIAMLIAAFFVPRAFEFIFLQLVAGIVATLTVVSIHKRADLFLTAAKIFLTYVIAGMGLELIRQGTLKAEDAVAVGYFSASAGLTLFAFPLVYLFEKMFGMVSDVSLLELSDTNAPLLRELNERAPGTFQHSLQVANLAEAAVQEIDGNTLLTRVGALYHDIGKMSDPQYFIENQASSVNPHDELSFDESAKIIINHVIRGIEIAQKYRLPDRVVDFIRTHHGTTTVQYFYRQYIKTFPEEMVDKERFSYPGPKPFSRETAVLMMSDAVEAASRSLPEKTAETLSNLVDQIIDRQMDEGQFEQVDLTFRDVERVKKVFKRKLRSIYHVRIAYPD